jgi:hypothetical protein
MMHAPEDKDSTMVIGTLIAIVLLFTAWALGYLMAAQGFYEDCTDFGAIRFHSEIATCQLRTTP